MIYQTLEEMPLTRFIDMYLGSDAALVVSGEHAEGELKAKASELIYEYSAIVKGRRQLADLYRKEELLCLQAKVSLLETCLKLIALVDGKETAIETLRQLGYSAAVENIEEKLNQILSKYRFQLEIAKNEDQKDAENPSERIDRSYFTKEMAMLMRHNKFVFNPREVSAAMYAHWLHDMIDYFNSKNYAK